MSLPQREKVTMSSDWWANITRQRDRWKGRSNFKLKKSEQSVLLYLQVTFGKWFCNLYWNNICYLFFFQRIKLNSHYSHDVLSKIYNIYKYTAKQKEENYEKYICISTCRSSKNIKPQSLKKHMVISLLKR